MFCYAFIKWSGPFNKFDGVNDYVRISDNSELDLTDNYTLEAWIFPETFDWLSESYQNIMQN